MHTRTQTDRDKPTYTHVPAHILQHLLGVADRLWACPEFSDVDFNQIKHTRPRRPTLTYIRAHICVRARTHTCTYTLMDGWTDRSTGRHTSI